MVRKLLKNAALLDANYENQVLNVLIEDDRIAAVGKNLSAAGAQVVDLTGCTLIPGIVNAHTHIHCAYDYTDDKFREMAKAGVCLCHDLGFLVNQPMEEVIDTVRRTNADPAYPAMDFAGRYIAVAGGYGDVIPGGFQVGELVESEEDCVKAVDYIIDSGCDCIKIGMDTGRGGTVETAITLPDNYVKAICDRAKERGVRVCTHVHELAYLERLVAGGITESSHVVKQPIPESLMQTMLDRGITLVATLTNFYRHTDRYSAEELQASVDNVRRYYDGGGVVAVATDFMWPFEKYLLPLEEMRLFRKTGLSTQEIIKCATLNGAKICLRENDYGTIEAGKYASLIAVKGEMDDDFKALESPVLVLNRGKCLANTLDTD